MPGGWRRLWQTGIRLWREAGRIGGLDQIAGEGFYLVMVSATTVVGRPVVVTGAASASIHMAVENRRKLVRIMRRYDPRLLKHPRGSFCETTLDRCPDCDTRFDPTNSELLELLEQPNVRCRRRAAVDLPRHK